MVTCNHLEKWMYLKRRNVLLYTNRSLLPGDPNTLVGTKNAHVTQFPWTLQLKVAEYQEKKINCTEWRKRDEKIFFWCALLERQENDALCFDLGERERTFCDMFMM